MCTDRGGRVSLAGGSVVRIVGWSFAVLEPKGVTSRTTESMSDVLELRFGLKDIP